MKTTYFHVGLHLTLNNVDYEIDRIKDTSCYLLRLKDGAIEVMDKVLMVKLLSEGQLTLASNQTLDSISEKPKADLSTLTVEQQKQIEYKLSFIERARKMLGDEPKTTQLDKVIEDIVKGDDKAPSPSTVYRWWKKWNDSYNDPLVLLNKKSGSTKNKTISNTVLEAFYEVVGEVYMTPQRVSKLTVRDMLSKRLKNLRYQGYSENESRMPSRAQFYRLFRKLDKFDVMCAREGRDKAEKKYRASGAGVIVKRILERVEVDHTPLDVLVVDSKTKEPLGRPTLTIYLDYCSKLMLGIEIGFEPPSEISVMRALKNAILGKDYANGFERVKEEWKAYGIPHTLICDNGLEFHSENLRRVCRELNIELQFCPKKQPHYKGAVERHIKTINNAVCHNLPGTTKTNIAERGDYNPREHAVCTLEEVNEYIHEWFINIYQNTFHRTTLRTPAKLWEEGLNQVEPILPESREKLDIITCKAAIKTLNHKGVEHNSLFYNSIVLVELRRRSIKNIKVSIRYDPMNLGYLWVLDDVNNDYLKVSCTTPEYADGLSERTHKAIRKARIEKGKQDFDTEKLQEYREEFATQLHELSKDKKLRTRTKVARFKLGSGKTHSKPETLSSVYKNDISEVSTFSTFDLLEEGDDD